MQDKIIILGAGTLQGPAIHLSGGLGLERYVLDGNAAAPHSKMGEHFFDIDLKKKQLILDLARYLKVKCEKGGARLGIMTAGTDFSASVAYAAETLDLPGHSYEAALNASDKARMRECFKKAGVPSPKFEIILDGKEAASCSLIPTSTSPLVVKPCDNMGGRGCSRVESAAELAEAVREAVRYSRTGRAIVEEFMDGREFSVDAIVHKGKITECGFADRHIFFPPYFVEMGHTMPSNIGAAEKKALMDCFEAGVRALGLSEGAAKGDLKLTSKGPMIGEIAARLSGGYMSGWTYPFSSGVEVTRAAIQIAMGREPDFSPVREDNFSAWRGKLPAHTASEKEPWTSAERAYISIPGTVRSVHALGDDRKLCDLTALRKREGLRLVFPRAGAGDKAAFPRNNVEKCGNVIAAAKTREEAVTAAESAVRSVLVKLMPNDPETERFLSMPLDIQFPPSAFSVPPHIAQLLLSMPQDNNAASALSILAFPELEKAGLRDWAGRTIEETLDAVRALTGLELTLSPAAAQPFFGRGFWTALLRGGYQGADYYVSRQK